MRWLERACWGGEQWQWWLVMRPVGWLVRLLRRHVVMVRCLLGWHVGGGREGMALLGGRQGMALLEKVEIHGKQGLVRELVVQIEA